jgi:hypothetical protein
MYTKERRNYSPNDLSAPTNKRIILKREIENRRNFVNINLQSFHSISITYVF